MRGNVHTEEHAMELVLDPSSVVREAANIRLKELSEGNREKDINSPTNAS